MKDAKSQRGSAMLEFVFTGIPLIFIWISTVQMALGMWHYHTLQYAVKMSGRYLAQHGNTCSTCTVQIKDVANVLATNAIGFQPSSIQVTFTSISPIDHATAEGIAINCRLDTCQTNTTQFPASAYNSPPQEFSILAKYRWSPAIGIVSPGAGRSFVFGSFWFPAYTHQLILF